LGTLKLLLANGDGTFQPARSLATFNGLAVPSFSADFNHDGNVDVIVHSCSPFNHPCGESLILSNGNGTFSSPPGSNVLTGGASIGGDFDGDGSPDLAGVDFPHGSPEIDIFLGKGDGSFQQPIKFPATNALSLAFSADLNGDQAPDLVIVNTDGTISVVLNSGTDFSLSATPLSPSHLGTGQSATSIVSLQLLNLFNNAVALSCSVQPAQTGAPTCAFNTNSVTFDSTGKANATLTISNGSSAMLKNRGPMNPAAPIWFPIAGLALFGTGFSLRMRNKRILLRIVPFALLGLLSLQACGGAGGGGSKSTSYAIKITGMSGQTTHSAIVNVTVQ
jgi:hypothetical protein